MRLFFALVFLTASTAFADVQPTTPLGEPCSGFCDYYFANSHFASEVTVREHDASSWEVTELSSTLTAANQIINGVGDAWSVEVFEIYSPRDKLIYRDDSRRDEAHTEDNSSYVEKSSPQVPIIVLKGNNRIVIRHTYHLRDRLQHKPDEIYHPTRVVEDM